jgi:GNAT superfamily N-acetyltransferase
VDVTGPSATRIRRARPGDEDALVRLVQELAAYERAADEVQASAADLGGALFGPVPGVWCHVAEDTGSGQVVGMALWFLTFSTWTGRHGIHLEDLYVSPAARGRGTGRALLAALATECLAHDWPRLEWAVLDWNAPAIGFYRAIGARSMDGWTTNRVTGPALKALASFPAGPAAVDPT